MKRWTDWQLFKAIVLILVSAWGFAIFLDVPLDRLLALFGINSSPF